MLMPKDSLANLGKHANVNSLIFVGLDSLPRVASRSRLGGGIIHRKPIWQSALIDVTAADRLSMCRKIGDLQLHELRLVCISMVLGIARCLLACLRDFGTTVRSARGSSRAHSNRPARRL